MSDLTIFDPVVYSREENQFLLEALGKPPVVVGREMPRNVNPAAIMPIVQRVYELEQLKAHEGSTWVGVDEMKKAINVFLEQDAKWERDALKSRNAPRWPSLYSFDARGRAHIGGAGSDSGHIRSYFDKDGKRKYFAIDLIPDERSDWQAPSTVDELPAEKELFEDTSVCRFECRVPKDDLSGVCGHTESYRPESRASRAAARARMSKHLRRATDNAEGHRELYTNEFNS